jgi:hypothetical protein
MVAPSDPWGSWFYQSWFCIMSGSYQVDLIISGPLVLEEVFELSYFAFLWLSSLWRWSGPFFEKYWIPFTQEWFAISLIEIGLLVLETFHFFFTLSLLSPLHLNNFKFPFPKHNLRQVWSKLAQQFWRRSRKCEKVYRRTDRRVTDNERSEKLTWAFSSCEQGKFAAWKFFFLPTYLIFLLSRNGFRHFLKCTEQNIFFVSGCQECFGFSVYCPGMNKTCLSWNNKHGRE